MFVYTTPPDNEEFIFVEFFLLKTTGNIGRDCCTESEIYPVLFLVV